MSGEPGWVKQQPEPPPDADAEGAGNQGIEAGDAGAGGTLDSTDGTLLGGSIAYRQYRSTYRTGLEPVLMAAAIPARPGQRVLEAGCGAGAGLLCLAARVHGVFGVGIEQDQAMAALAVHNLRRNDLDWPVRALPVQEFDARAEGGLFHHAFANPPWHRSVSTRSTDARRDLARRAPEDTLPLWSMALASALRRGGSLTLALPARLHAEAGAAMLRAGFGSLVMMPFWPKPDRPARIVLLRGVLGGRGDGVVLPGLVLHRADDHGFTEAAEAVLRHGAALPLYQRGRRGPCPPTDD